MRRYREKLESDANGPRPNFAYDAARPPELYKAPYNYNLQPANDYSLPLDTAGALRNAMDSAHQRQAAGKRRSGEKRRPKRISQGSSEAEWRSSQRILVRSAARASGDFASEASDGSDGADAAFARLDAADAALARLESADALQVEERVARPLMKKEASQRAAALDARAAEMLFRPRPSCCLGTFCCCVFCCCRPKQVKLVAGITPVAEACTRATSLIWSTWRRTRFIKCASIKWSFVGPTWIKADHSTLTNSFWRRASSAPCPTRSSCNKSSTLQTQTAAVRCPRQRCGRGPREDPFNSPRKGHFSDCRNALMPFFRRSKCVKFFKPCPNQPGPPPGLVARAVFHGGGPEEPRPRRVWRERSEAAAVRLASRHSRKSCFSPLLESRASRHSRKLHIPATRQVDGPGTVLKGQGLREFVPNPGSRLWKSDQIRLRKGRVRAQGQTRGSTAKAETRKTRNTRPAG
ncbi:hypothetical protein M885DRAFT_36958 [Pelagophyceae sp. CCMP2097]|nr:hypothetical protein M885DRAFT_36958 [Pelagophyceae sp. CCMP2097]